MKVVLVQGNLGFCIAEERDDRIGKYLSEDGKWTSHMKWSDDTVDGGTYHKTFDEAMRMAFRHGCVVVRMLVDLQPSGSSTQTPDNDTRTIKQLASNALYVQNASNILGVVKSFERDLRRLRVLLNLDDNGLRNHSIIVMYVSKIQSMVDDSGTALSNAMDECKKLADNS